MSPRQREYFRQKLLNWREELLNEAQATLEQLRDDSHRDVGDEIDCGSREASQALELRTRDHWP